MLEPDTNLDDSRRDFLKSCLGSLAGVTMIAGLAPLVGACTSSKASTSTGFDENFSATFDVGALGTDGEAMMTETTGADGKPIIIVRKSATTYTALSANCTHKGCTVNPPNDDEIVCACHNSVFNLDGGVMRGPARTPLYRYATTYDAATRSLAVRVGSGTVE